MKRVLLYHWLIVTMEWTAVYLLAAWTRWEFFNPFQWLIDIPTYQMDSRFFLLMGILIWHILQITLIYNIIKEYDKSRART